MSLLLITAVSTFDDNFASAQLVTETLDEPIDYEFGVGLFDVGVIDLNTGSYEVTFWLSIKTENGNFTEYMPQLHFVNGAITDRSNMYISDNWYNERIQGKFFNDMDFSTYPFSQIDLDIIIEFSQTSSELATFYVDPVLSYAFEKYNIPGWSIADSRFSTTLQEYYELGSFPRYIASYTVETPFLSSFISGVLPIIVIALLSLITFRVEAARYVDKIRIIIALLLATIFYHVLSVMTSLPALDYLTIQDKLMALVYVILVYGILEIFLQMRYHGIENKEIGEAINKKVRYTLPIVISAIIIFFWFI